MQLEILTANAILIPNLQDTVYCASIDTSGSRIALAIIAMRCRLSQGRELHVLLPDGGCTKVTPRVMSNDQRTARDSHSCASKKRLSSTGSALVA